MPGDKPIPKPRWTIESLIDLEYLLHRRGDFVDTGFFESEIEPWIEPARIDRPDAATTSRALWLWLQRRRAEVPDHELPGHAFSGAHVLLSLILCTIMFLGGTGLVFSLLRYDERTFNIALLLALTLGVQWALLLGGFLGFLTWGWWRAHPFLSLAQRIVFALNNRLVRRALGEDASRWWRETARSRSLFAFPALRLTQTAGIAFNLGVILAFTAAVLFLSVRFAWETTTPDTMIPTFDRAVSLLGLPWSWFQPEWVPSTETIRNSLIKWQDQSPVGPSAETAARWIPFLAASLLVWGLLPRLLLRIGFGLRERAALDRYSFQERVHREWWRHLTDFPITVANSGPADGAFALLWGGMTPDPENLRRLVLQQLRLNIESSATLGRAGLEEDEAALSAASRFLRAHPGAALIVVAEAWALTPKEFQDTLTQLRAAVGEAEAIQILLVGVPSPDGTLAAPSPGDVTVWDAFAAELNDPALFVKPMRQ